MNAEGIRELFADILPVRMRRLFGCLGVYDGEVIFALVFKGDVYLKTSPATLERFMAAGCQPFTYESRGRERALGYWSLPDAALDDPDTLRIWTDLARNAAREKALRVKPRGSRLRAPLR